MLLLLGCGTPEPEVVETPPVQRSEAIAAAEEAPPVTIPEVAEDGDLVPIEITWRGISALYKGFFQEREALTALSQALHPYLNGPVQLQIAYNSEDFVGDIVVLVPPGGLKSPVAVEQGRVELAQLAPITAALASYRDAVSGLYDVRLQSFRVGLDFFRGPVHCRIGVAGTPPPDGRTVSPCPQVNGSELCGRPEGGAVVFDEAGFKKLETCLDG